MSAQTVSDAPEITSEDVRDHLQGILADRRFATAERNAKFLRYVVEATLNGKASEIKETVIGSEVYGRPRDYDPKVDSIVRVEASRLRQKLRSYYENEGRLNAIRIHLPSGGYVPSFEMVNQPANQTSMRSNISELSPAAPVEAREPAKRKVVIAGGLTALAAVFLIALSIQAARLFNTPNSQEAEAAAAWREGVALLAQDPHSGETQSGPPKTLLRAIERLELAVALNAKDAPAWATLAEAYDYASSYIGRNTLDDAKRAEAAARRAISLDEKLAAGHHMLALIHKGIKWDFAEAEGGYRHVLSLDPRNAYAVVEYADLLWETGRAEQAAEEIRKARVLQPALPVLVSKDAEIQLYLGRPSAAVSSAEEAIHLNRTYFRAYVALGAAYEAMGKSELALSQFEHVLQSNPFDRRALPAYGYLLAKLGHSKRAREVAARLEQMNSTVRNCAFQVAVVYAGLGEDDRALDWLETAWRTRQAHFPFATVEHRFASLRAKPRFQELLGRVGLKAFPANSVT